ncbi:MAG: PadR family transcriptional regulator [Candidatus Thorarchaeota archaeon]
MMSIRPFLPTGGKLTPMQLLIFIQLLEGPKYGYEILTNLRSTFEGAWVPKTGTLYPALKTLVKKGFISEKTVKETTYYRLTEKGLDYVRDTRDFVKEYVLFNYQFMTVAAEKLPSEFIMDLLVNLQEMGIEDIIPEKTIVESIRSIPDVEVQKQLLELRKGVLLDKVSIIRKELKAIEGEKQRKKRV